MDFDFIADLFPDHRAMLELPYVGNYNPYEPSRRATHVLEADYSTTTVSFRDAWPENNYSAHSLNHIAADCDTREDQNTTKPSVLPISAKAKAKPSKLRKKKAPTLRESDWEPYKAQIIDLHITNKRPLPEVRSIMERQYGFNAELRQYRSRMSKWKLDKNIKPKEMQSIVRKRQKRMLTEADKGRLTFRVRGEAVKPEKIERWMRRHNISDDEPYTPISSASTPSDVSCATISDRGSPVPVPTYKEGYFIDPQRSRRPPKHLFIDRSPSRQ